MATEILTHIRSLLTAAGVAFREVHHEPTATSEDSARARGEELRVGGKALLLRGDDEYALFVLPADRKIDSRRVRTELGWRKLRFATRNELWELTGLSPGSVPPFGRPILPFPLYVDSGIPENDRIAFSAGSLTDSMVLAMPDYLQVAAPVRIFSFSTTTGTVDTVNT